MRTLWICGLPNEVRIKGWNRLLSEVPTPAWSWILGHLPPEGVDLHIMCPVVGLVEPQIDFDYLGAHWHCFRRKRFVHVLSYIKHMIVVRRFVRQLNPDVIQGWGGETGFGFFATRCSRRAVVSVQGLLLYFMELSSDFACQMNRIHGRYMIARERKTYRDACRCTAESETSALALKRHYGVDGIVIPHPLRSAFYGDEAATQRDASPTFLYVGNLCSRKGALDLVGAFGRVKDDRARLIMIGDGVDRQLVLDSISAAALQDRVSLKLTCSADEIVTLMRRAHIFVLPSYGDTGPTALKEAIACGLFPICYDNSGPHEYISKYCGYLCEAGNVQMFADLMNKAIQNLESCQQEAARAAERIKEDLSKAKVWEKLRKLYEEVAT